MDRKAQAFHPEASPLESKLLLSASATPGRALAEVAILSTEMPVASARRADLLKGRYFAAEDGRPADAPLDAQLDGAGRVRGMGQATLSGSIQFGGLRMPNLPDITGTVTLKGARGSVTLNLTGFSGNGQVPDSTFTLRASVVSGTGAFVNVRRIGKATVEFGPNTVQSIAAPSPIGGTLTIRLELRRPAR